ncbi:hypothetical protein, partial [Mesorhizobium sp. M0276]|uniref:hypothetical protein n=1 Tax=Mesorhizobium sp. M0276 TaxID=2956928 RepID=UPI0033351E55
LCAPLVKVAAWLSPATLHLSVNDPMAPSRASQMVLHRDDGRPPRAIGEPAPAPRTHVEP